MSRMLRERIIENFDEIRQDPRGMDSKKLDDLSSSGWRLQDCLSRQ